MTAAPTPGKRIRLLVNPTAGRGSARRLIRPVVETLGRGFAPSQVEVVASTDFRTGQQAAIDIARQAGPDDLLVAMGGDGMVGMVMDVAATHPISVGLIPAGTGNDLCRGLGIPRDPVAAAQVMVDVPARPVDQIVAKYAPQSSEEADTRRVSTIVATGFDARVNRRANHSHLPIGSLRYAAAVITELATFRPLHYRLQIDGQVREFPAMLVAVANTAYFGGGIEIAPGADPMDGLLDVTIIHPASRRDLVRLMPALYRGTFVSDPVVERLRVSEMEIDGDEIFAMGDGEELGAPPVHLRVDPGAVMVHAPASVLD